MLWWLLGFAAFVLILGALWRDNRALAAGVLLGLPIAWVLSKFLAPYVTGMEHIPLWLPPLPFAIVAVTLLVMGVVIWLRADRLPPPPARDDEQQHH